MPHQTTHLHLSVLLQVSMKLQLPRLSSVHGNNTFLQVA